MIDSDIYFWPLPNKQIWGWGWFTNLKGKTTKFQTWRTALLLPHQNSLWEILVDHHKLHVIVTMMVMMMLRWSLSFSFLWPIIWKPKNPFPLRFVFSLLQSPPRMSFMLPIFLFVLLFISHICRLTCAIFFTKFPTSNWSWCAQSALLLCIVHSCYQMQ